MRDHFFNIAIPKFSTSFLLATVLALLVACSDNSGGTATSTTTSTTATASVASIQISGAPTTINTDNSNSTTITVTAVDSSNATVSGATITLSTSTGLLSASALTTDATGKATATFSSGAGPANQANRTATITATAGAATALLPVQVIGSTLALSALSTSLLASGASPTTLTITAKDAGGLPISGAAVTLTQTGTGAVTLTPATGTTDALGKLSVSVAGATAGTATVSAAAVGATATINFTVAASSTTFGISLVTLNAGVGVIPVSPKTSAMQIGDSLAVQVTAPAPTTSVMFATSVGTWSGATVGTVVSGTGTGILIVTPAAGIATATLSTTVTGVASVDVLDSTTPAIKDTLSVGITAKIAAKISLQASPTVIPKSVGSTVGYSNLTATVYDALNQPVGGMPVAFSIVSGTGTGSGETVSPVVVYSASTITTGLALGEAPTTFTSGSLPSGFAGVQVRASVVGTSIATQPIGVTNSTTSSFDAAITIGGTAGSVAFGQAAKIIDAGTVSTIYSFPMSVLVADSSGSPAPLGTVVNISAWPIAWTTGSRGFGCDPDPDGFVWDTGTLAYVAGNGGTFYNEDINQNLILDSGEDGVRKYYASGTTVAGGATNSQITPLNSWGGTVASTNPADLPGTATTNAYGLATFNLTYTKSSAFWIISRIRAQTVVQGSPAVGQLDFRLLASEADATPTKCYLPPSPFIY